MTTLTFIRHAETTYNKSETWAGRIDCSITSEGFEEAKHAFENYEMHFDFIYCSPLKRTQETLAAIIPNSTPLIDERIIEACIGEWEGKKKSLFDSNLIEKYKLGEYTPTKGESFDEVDKRVCNFIEDLFNTYTNDEKILIVTHNGVMRSIKRNFIEEYDNIMSKNLECIVLNKNNYDYYLKSKKSK